MEKDIEDRFVSWVEKKYNYPCLKFTPESRVGYPDRLILADRKRPVFIEFKDEGKKPRKIQDYRHIELEVLGYVVKVFDSLKEAKDWFESYIQTS